MNGLVRDMLLSPVHQGLLNGSELLKHSFFYCTNVLRLLINKQSFHLNTNELSNEF